MNKKARKTNCGRCAFWDNSVSLPTKPETGRCLVNPPTADDRTGEARWPFTDPDDWCRKGRKARNG